MDRRFVVLHKKGELSGFSSDWLEWKTCLRHILIGREELLQEDLHLQSETEIYKGVSGIQFLMEIASGLHSPMVAETEVFGQYRKFITEAKFTECDWGAWVSRVLEQIRISVKRVRHQHLTGIGSSSYGSLIRKKSKGEERINLIGAGLLVKDILPWIAKFQGEVNVFCRNPEKAQSELSEFSFINIHSVLELDDHKNGTFVVCAPMSAGVLADKIGQSENKIIDLRGESRKDPIICEAEVESLSELFKQIEGNKLKAQKSVQNARVHIEELVDKALTL